LPSSRKLKCGALVDERKGCLSRLGERTDRGRSRKSREMLANVSNAPRKIRADRGACSDRTALNLFVDCSEQGAEVQI
jgi:hypothetical protein